MVRPRLRVGRTMRWTGGEGVIKTTPLASCHFRRPRPPDGRLSATVSPQRAPSSHRISMVEASPQKSLSPPEQAMTRSSPPWRLVAGLAVVVALPLGAQTNVAQQGWNPQEILGKETYVKPPAIVERIVTAPRNNVTFTNPSPDKRYFLKTESEGLPSIDAFGKLHYRLGGV